MQAPTLFVKFMTNLVLVQKGFSSNFEGASEWVYWHDKTSFSKVLLPVVQKKPNPFITYADNRTDIS
jgi:hypothetical protein